jgi:hypothetical protein
MDGNSNSDAKNIG